MNIAAQERRLEALDKELDQLAFFEERKSDLILFLRKTAEILRLK